MDEDSGDREQVQRIERAAATLSLIYGVVSLMWLMWYLIPAHQRRLLLMQATWHLHQTAQNAASRAGQQAMAREIRGSSPHYEIPYLLSAAAAAARRVYDRARYV